MSILAINGGRPVREKLLQYGRQYVDEDDINMVVRCLRGDYLTTGPYVEMFEQTLREVTGAEYAVAVANGTVALHIACQAAGIGRGDEVITTPISFAATANCIRYCDAVPVFADIDPKTCLIDSDEIEKKITVKTKAIIPVHYAGEVCDMEAIGEIAKRHNLIVIEDAAHAIGSCYKSRPVGSISNMTVFSFHPVKTVTTGEGGAVTTNDRQLYEKLKLFRSHGITRIKEQLHNKQQGDWYYEQLELGSNHRITDFQCALGIGQLKKLNRFKLQRERLVKKYDDVLKTWDTLRLLVSPPWSDATRHLYPIQLIAEHLTVSRKTTYEALKAEGIGVNVHYIPIYWFPYYKRIGYKMGICPLAESVYANLITLPLYPNMSDTDFDDVITALDKVVSFYHSSKKM